MAYPEKVCLAILSAILLLNHIDAQPPPRGVQLGLGGPRPVAYGTGPSRQPISGPNFSHQLAFGPPPSGSQRGRPVSGFPQQTPIVLTQRVPATTIASVGRFPSSTTARQPVQLKSPGISQPSEEEYEYEEYEDEVPPVAHRPIPNSINTTPQRTRTPVRIQPSPQIQSTRQVVPPRFSTPQRIPPPTIERRPSPQSFPSPPTFTRTQPIVPSPQVPSAPVRRPVQATPTRRPVSQSPPPQRFQSSPVVKVNRPEPSSSRDSDRQKTPPIQTVNRYMKHNDDGSITWGYENEDGSFKEETLGADCVVRGKYGYIDPDGNKREYQYQTGNPCDPNKKDEEEEEDYYLDGPNSQQEIGAILSARPRPQAQRRPVVQQPRYN